MPGTLLQRRTLIQGGNGLPATPLTPEQIVDSGVTAILLGGAPIASPAFVGVASGDAFSATGLTGATAGGRYVGTTAAGAPATGAFLKGDWCTDQAGKRWTCTVAGSPGTWVQEPGSGGGAAGKVVALGNVSGVIACDLSQGVAFSGTVTGNITGVAFTNWPAAPAITEPLLILKMAAAGGPFTITLPSVTWAPSGIAPGFDLAPNHVNLIPLSSPDQGATIYGGPAAAPLDSPAFTGTPTATTPPTGDNSTRVATTAFVLTNGGGGGGTAPQVDGGTPSSTYQTAMDGGTP